VALFLLAASSSIQLAMRNRIEPHPRAAADSVNQRHTPAAMNYLQPSGEFSHLTCCIDSQRMLPFRERAAEKKPAKSAKRTMHDPLKPF